jgi:hypothetical protein
LPEPHLLSGLFFFETSADQIAFRLWLCKDDDALSGFETGTDGLPVANKIAMCGFKSRVLRPVFGN